MVGAAVVGGVLLAAVDAATLVAAALALLVVAVAGAAVAAGVVTGSGTQTVAFRSGRRKRTGNSFSPLLAVLMSGVRSKVCPTRSQDEAAACLATGI